MNTFATKLRDCGIFAVLFLLTLNGFAQLQVSIATTPSCKNDGSLTATVTGGVPPYTYTWTYWSYEQNKTINVTSSSGVLSGLRPSDYYLKVSDKNNVTAFAYATIHLSIYFDGPTADFNIDSLTCRSYNVSAVIGGTPTLPITYAWSTGHTTATVTGLDPYGTKPTCTATDAAGCVISQQVYIPYQFIPGHYQTEVATTPDSCGLGGTATVTFQGGTPPHHIMWNTGDTIFSITRLYASLGYRFRITDANGCQEWGNVSVPRITSRDFNAWATAMPASFGHDGSITIEQSGGVAPYTYTWEGVPGLSVQTHLDTGWVNYTVTDATGCIVRGSANVTLNRIVPVSEKLAIYPNPATSAIACWSSQLSPDQPATLQVYDAAGNRLIDLEQPLVENNRVLHLGVTSLRDGLYYVVVRQGDVRVQGSFLKVP